MKRILTLILAVLMCFGTLLSCSKEEEVVEGETEAVSTDDGIEYDENGYQMDKLGTMDFGGREIRICGWSNIEDNLPEFSVESMGLGTVSNAAFIKNYTVEQRLKVRLKFETMDGWTGQGTATAGQAQLTRVQTAAGTTDIDIIGTYSWNPATFMNQGLLSDLNAMPHIDFTAPWWNASVVEKSSVYGKLFFATGDIAPSLIRETYAVFFNKSVAAQYDGMEDLYDLYENGQWTIDKMMELSASVASDLGESGKDKGDKFGLVTFGTATDAFYQGSDLMEIENAADGSMLVSEDFRSEKTHNLLEKLIGFSKTDAFWINDSYESAWKQGNSLFTLTTFAAVENWTDSNAKDFGILPMPKYDTDQTEYRTLVGFFHTMYCVPIALKGDEEIGATLECMASECYRKVTPAYYEDLIQSRYSATVDEAIMFDNVRACVVVDSGRIFNQLLHWKIAQQFRINLVKGDLDWFSACDVIIPTIEKNLTSLNEGAATFG